MRSHLQPNSPILLSFFPRQTDGNSFKLITLIANILSKLRLKKGVELGDSLLPHNIFVHYFVESEIKYELEKANFNFVSYNDEEYGYAVGIAN